VDSDVLIDPSAIRQLVRRFTCEQIAAVGGWVDARNKHDNWLTQMPDVVPVTLATYFNYFAMFIVLVGPPSSGAGPSRSCRRRSS
jgi:hypothetical protein